MRGMLDRLFFPILGLVTGLLIALAMVWPQGLGDRSPAPFGSTPVQQTPHMQAAMQRQAQAAQRDAERARAAVSTLQTQAVETAQ
jgi:hypothetical protein